MSIEENIAIVRRFTEEVFNRKNLEVDELLTADHMRHQSGVDEDWPTFKQQLPGLFAAFPDWHVEVKDIFGVGDKVVARRVVTGTNTGPFRGQPATGKSFSADIMAIIQLENGKIAEAWTVFDALSMYQQLGLLPTPNQ